jgi:hypothetical protein
MARRTWLDRIRGLDPERDHLQIAYIDAFYEFPFDTAHALDFALFRTFAVPSIGALLDRTGQFQYFGQKRYDDTDLLLSEVAEHGYDSERGRAAIRRINQIHGRFAISNDDFLYVLSTFVFEPERWINRFGWRPLVEQERQAAFIYWREIGRRMNIQGLPADRAAFEHFNREYERTHFRYTDASHRVGVATRDLLLSWYLPGPLRRLGEPFAHALMDDPLLEAFGFPRPPPGLRWLVEGTLRLRARLVRLLPPRRRPRLRTALPRPTYPRGYRIEELGPTRSPSGAG